MIRLRCRASIFIAAGSGYLLDRADNRSREFFISLVVISETLRLVQPMSRFR